MTPAEIDDDRATCLCALADPSHPWRTGLDVFIGAYDTADQKGREFMRKIAPYMFDGDVLLRPAMVQRNDDQGNGYARGDDPIVVRGVFAPADDVVWADHEPSQASPLMIRLSSRWFWVDWYAETLRCPMVSLEWHQADGQAVSASARALEPYETIPAEWWRRLGYRVIARPLDLLAWHLWRRWQRDWGSKS